MVSLGPLAAKKHCPFSCAFCYVQDDFKTYPALPEDDIIAFLKQNEGLYQIIYVSGDTDSFAPPRTNQGLHLLRRISTMFDCDLLFTSRTTFAPAYLKIINEIAVTQVRKHKRLYACISISRYSESLAYLEPKPIPHPEQRITTLNDLHEAGAVTVLAMRPFLPVVPISDYLTILRKSHRFVDIVLGEHFYFTRNGMVCKRVFPQGIETSVEKDITQGNKMPFDVNDSDWNIWYSPEYEEAVRNKCQEYGIVFSMHSRDAIEKFNKTYPL